MLTYCEIDTEALGHNIGVLRDRLKPGVVLAPTVKGNAYGHGLVQAARAFLSAGADWLCVNAVYEAAALRAAGIDAPLYVMGHVAPSELEEAIALDCRMVLYDGRTLEGAASWARKMGRVARFHVKIETGNNRQGLASNDALELARAIDRLPGATLEGVASHFANIEDTTDHAYAHQQIDRFASFCARLDAEGLGAPMRHIANSAATLLMDAVHLDMVRPGISAYGMWPSRETKVAALLSGRPLAELRPALTWRASIAQVKTLGAGEFVGYGCTYKTTHATRLAVLPVGYYDGYDRALSNIAYVLIDGQRAPVRGRVCMNMIMVDVTDIPQAHPGIEAVLLGRSGAESLTAEQLADWAGTINYEITTRINERIPRIAAPR